MNFIPASLQTRLPVEVHRNRPCMSPLGHLSSIESVAEPSQAEQIARSLRIGLDLLAEVRHLVIDGAFGHADVFTPCFIE
jgi:hypothetical protein